MRWSRDRRRLPQRAANRSCIRGFKPGNSQPGGGDAPGKARNVMGSQHPGSLRLSSEDIMAEYSMYDRTDLVTIATAVCLAGYAAIGTVVCDVIRYRLTPRGSAAGRRSAQSCWPR